MGLNVLGYQSHIYFNVAKLPVVTNDLPILCYDFFIATQVQHSYTSSTDG